MSAAEARAPAAAIGGRAVGTWVGDTGGGVAGELEGLVGTGGGGRMRWDRDKDRGGNSPPRWGLVSAARDGEGTEMAAGLVVVVAAGRRLRV